MPIMDDWRRDKVDCLMDNPVSGLQWLFCPHARMAVIMQKGP